MLRNIFGKIVHDPKFYKFNYHFAKIFFGGDLIRCISNKNISNDQRIKTIKYYLTNKSLNIFATLPRSGTHYASLALSLAYDFRNGGAGNYRLNEKDVWETDFDCSRVRIWHVFDEKIDNCEPEIWHTHAPCFRIPVIRNENCRYVVFVRDIFKQQESYYYIFNQRDNIDVKGYITLGHLRDAINYLNSYGYLHDRFPDRVIFVKYEELISNPLQELKRIVKALRLDLKEEHLLRAIPLCTREEMAKRIPVAYRKHNEAVTLKKRTYPFDAGTHNYINRYISNNLKYSFGYEYEK